MHALPSLQEFGDWVHNGATHTFCLATDMDVCQRLLQSTEEHLNRGRKE